MPEVLTRPARVLIGWLDEATGVRLLRAKRRRDEDDAAVRAQLASARAAVAAREASEQPSTSISALPDGYEHLAERGIEIDGTTSSVRLVRLASLLTAQPYVFTDRPPRLGPTPSLDEVARITLPSATGSDTELGFELGFDAASATFRASSASQNLRILGEFAGPIPGAPTGALGIGFLVSAPPSLMRVATIDGRALLVDGLHRAVALIAAGITEAPAVLEEDSTAEQWWTPGMLDAATCFGARPPFVGDLLDDSVAASTLLHHVGRAVEIGAREIDLTGDPT